MMPRKDRPQSRDQPFDSTPPRATGVGRKSRANHARLAPLWIAAGDFEQSRGGCSRRRRCPLVCASGRTLDSFGAHLS